MRAADADRDRVLEIVRQGHAEGRLSIPEFYDRLEAVYQAKTYAELDEVVRDLPAVGDSAPAFAAAPAPTVARPSSASSLARMPSELRGLWVTWATSVAICVLIWFLTTGPGDDSFWPIWVAGPWGVVNLGITFTWWLNRNSEGGGPPALPPGSS